MAIMKANMLPAYAFLALAACTPIGYILFGTQIISLLNGIVIASILYYIFQKKQIPVPLFLTLLISVMYAIAPLIDIALFDNFTRVSEKVYYELALPIIYIYCFGLLLGASLKGHSIKSKANNISNDHLLQRKTRISLALLFGLSMLMTIIQLDKYELTADLQSRSTIYVDSNTLLDLSKLFVAVGIIYTTSLLRKIKLKDKQPGPKVIIVYALSTLSFVFFSLVLGDRRLISAVALATLFSSWCQLVAWFRYLWVLPVVPVLWIYTYFRNTPIALWSSIIQQLDWANVLNPANGELGGWTRISNDLLILPFQDLSRLTIFNAPLSIIPSILYPDRPLGSALWYVQEYDPATALAGGGWAFSLPIEGYLNLWFLGPFVFGLLISIAISALQHRDEEHLMLASFIFAFSFRMDLATLLQISILSLLILNFYKLFPVLLYRKIT